MSSIDRRAFLRRAGLLAVPVIAGCTDEYGGDRRDTPTKTSSPSGTETATPTPPTADAQTESSTPTPTETLTETPTPSQRESGIQVGMRAADVTFTTLEGRQIQLSDYRDRKVMAWFFTTWCPSCQRSAQILQQHHEQLQSLTILAVKTYKNAGYSGPSVRQFATEYAPQTLNSNHWVWGTAGKETTQTYNPRNLTDIYYLIDQEGIIQTVDTVPGTTIHKVAEFANR